MQRFDKILYVCTGLEGENDALRQALRLTCDNKGSLSILMVLPSFPTKLKAYKNSYKKMLEERMDKAIGSEKSALGIRKKLPITVESISGSAPAIQVIRHVLQHSNDLLIKQAEASKNEKGFKSLDMELLRKCPCPVLLVRPLKHKGDKIQVSVAIDPENEERVGHDLALQLLQLSSSLAASYSGQLHIISCWNFELEKYLRDQVWIKVSKEELDDTLLEKKTSHEKALNQVISESKIKDGYQIHQLKGLPEEVIPSFIDDMNIDILVMGTVARTGISGFIFGNTAENIVQTLNCSLLALKPHGFTSPVKPY